VYSACMVNLDIRDWLIIILVAFIMAIATVYLFTHPSPAAFATWGGVAATVSTMYHWIVFRDSKIKDNSL
jgi:uncharacterized membrane-anchored protein YitT (DUF2179 family)